MKKSKKQLNKQSKTTVENSPKSKNTKWEFIISTVASIAAVISVIIAIITVHQMKIDRDAAYKPSILINPTQYEFSWDETGKSNWIASIVNEKAETNIDQEGPLTEDIRIPISVLLEDTEKFSAVNVGVGTATQVVFEWHESNIYNLNDYLIQCDETKKNFMEINNSAVINYNSNIVAMGLPSNVALMYMLPEANETYEISLPTAYYVLIQEIIKSGGKTNDIPYLKLSANYTDIQGNEYTDIFLFNVKLILKVEDESGAGKASFQLVPSFVTQ